MNSNQRLLKLEFKAFSRDELGSIWDPYKTCMQTHPKKTSCCSSASRHLAEGVCPHNHTPEALNVSLPAHIRQVWHHMHHYLEPSILCQAEAFLDRFYCVAPGRGHGQGSLSVGCGRLVERDERRESIHSLPLSESPTSGHRRIKG